MITLKESIIYNIFVPSHLVNEHYEDRYFDADHAIEEAKYIYFEGTKLLEKITMNKPFVIGETGFGAGRILISLIDYLDNSGLKNLNIIYNSVELHPLSSKRISLMLDSFKEKNGRLIDEFIQNYNNLNITKKGLHQIIFKRDFGTITLNLWIGEALEMVNQLTIPCHAWFLDGHNPKKNPDIWRPELLKLISEKTQTNGTCASFTVSPIVISDLSQAGFKIEQHPGLSWKKSVLRGLKI